MEADCSPKINRRDSVVILTFKIQFLPNDLYFIYFIWMNLPLICSFPPPVHPNITQIGKKIKSLTVGALLILVVAPACHLVNLCVCVFVCVCVATGRSVAYQSEWCTLPAPLPGGSGEFKEKEKRWRGERETSTSGQSKLKPQLLLQYVLRNKDQTKISMFLCY